MEEIECPRCRTEFDAKEWNDGECPNCNNDYQWDEQCTEDYSDCWSVIIWKHYEK